MHVCLHIFIVLILGQAFGEFKYETVQCTQTVLKFSL